MRPGSMDGAGVPVRLAAVRERIAAAEERFGRRPGSVALLAVSKKQGTDKIRAAHEAGQRAFGESYVDEALVKMGELTGLPLDWHFIGRIQGNKTRRIAAGFAWVHSLCDPHHAHRLSDQRPPGMPPLKVFLQVNVSGEASKSGVPPREVADLLAVCRGLPAIEVVGLMTLPAPAVGEALQRAPFRALRVLRDELATADLPLAELSMGMTDDLEAAVAEGATMVRVGTAIFGPRPAS